MSSAALSITKFEPAPTGWVHSYETSAGLDGSGWRFVLFLSGCPLRCKYCHNPDTWHRKAARQMPLASVMERIGRYRMALKRGGITISGGEPLTQAPFVAAVARGAKQWGLHVALDTSGALGAWASDDMLADIDLVMLDIKAWNPDTYLWLTHHQLEPTLTFARRLAAMGKTMWLRYVLLPGINDDRTQLAGVAGFAASLGNVERVDVLPFHQLGESKWEARGLKYELAGKQPPTPEQVAEAVGIFTAAGLAAY
jgi:pyruvate formate lyase activating enzyme